MAGDRPVVQLQIKFALQSNELERERGREHWLEVSCWMGLSAITFQCLTSSALTTRFLNKLFYFAVWSQNVKCPNTQHKALLLLKAARPTRNWSCNKNKNWSLTGVESLSFLLLSTIQIILLPHKKEPVHLIKKIVALMEYCGENV